MHRAIVVQLKDQALSNNSLPQRWKSTQLQEKPNKWVFLLESQRLRLRLHHVLVTLAFGNAQICSFLKPLYICIFNVSLGLYYNQKSFLRTVQKNVASLASPFHFMSTEMSGVNCPTPSIATSNPVSQDPLGALLDSCLSKYTTADSHPNTTNIARS